MKEEKKLPTLKLGGREIPLYYSTYEAIAIQKDIGCTVYQLNDEVVGIYQEDEDDPTSMRFGIIEDAEKQIKLGTLIRILGNAGLEEEGKEPDLTDKWVLRHMNPLMITMYAMAIAGIIFAGNDVEQLTSKEEEGPVDEILEEQQSKKRRGN